MSRLFVAVAAFCLSTMSWAAPPNKAEGAATYLGRVELNCDAAGDSVASSDLPSPPPGFALVIRQYSVYIPSAYSPGLLSFYASEVGRHIGTFVQLANNNYLAQNDNANIWLLPNDSLPWQARVMFQTAGYNCPYAGLYFGSLDFVYSFENAQVGVLP